MKNTKFKLSKIELVTIQRFFDNIKLLISITKKTNIFLKIGFISKSTHHTTNKNGFLYLLNS